MHYEKNSFCGTPRASVLRQRGGPDSRRMAAPEGPALRQRNRHPLRRPDPARQRRPAFARPAGVQHRLCPLQLLQHRLPHGSERLSGLRRLRLLFHPDAVYMADGTYGVGMAQKQGRRLSEQRPLWQRLLRVLRGEQTRLGQCVPHHAVLDSPLGVRSAYGFHTGHDVRAAEPSAL